MPTNRRVVLGAGLTAAASIANTPAGAAEPGGPEQPTPADLGPRRSPLLRYSPAGIVLWQRSVPLHQNESGSAAVVTRDRVFLAQSGALRSFDVHTGEPGWLLPFAGSCTDLLAVDGLILVGLVSASYTHPQIVALDAVDGTHRWTHSPRTDAIELHPVRAGLVIAQQRHTTVALDTATGRVRWRAPAPDDDHGGAAFAQIATSPTTVVQGGEPTTVGLDAYTGRRLWAIRPALGAAYPLLTGSVVLLAPIDSGGTQPGGVLAVDARTGLHNWTVPSADKSGSVVAAGHGVVVAVTGDGLQGGRTTAVATDTGRILWSSDIPAASSLDQPSAITATRIAYIEDHRDEHAHPHRVIALVCRRLHDGQVLYRHRMSQPETQGPPRRYTGAVLPLTLDSDDHEPGHLRSFSLDRNQVDFTVRLPHFTAAPPVVLSDGSLVAPTADIPEAVGL